MRTRSTSSRPSTLFRAAMILLRAPIGAASRSASMVRRARRVLTKTITPATKRAAIGSALTNQVQRGMRSFRQNAQAAGGNADENLQASYGQRSPQRIGCGPALLGLHRLGTEGRWHT